MLDTIHGRIVNVDIDVDSDYDGDIDDADEPLEETPGGFAGVDGADLTPIKLSFGPLLAQLPGKLKLSATKGENHIRLWRDAQRSDQVALPTVWQNPSQMPTTLYVEGVAPSANVRDVELSLEYDTPFNSECPCDVQGLLTLADGRCGAWARFFRDTIKAQGITGAKVMVIEPQGLDCVSSALWVKNQDMGKLLLHPPQFPTPLPGIPGQGSADPSQSVFSDHAVVQYGTKLYDPSYGTTFQSLIQWQRASLDLVSVEKTSGNFMLLTNSGAAWPLCVKFSASEP